MSTQTIADVDLSRLCDQLRVDILRMTDRAQSGHPTSALSAVELAVVLAARHMRLDPDRPDHPGNDHLVLSKGHASPLLYALLRALGLVDEDELLTYRQQGSRLEGHPTPRVPLVDAATGSLGQGLSIGVGLALDARLKGSPRRTFVLCGDSELAEGAVWEAAEHAGHEGIDNLVLLVDVNRLGQRGPTRHEWNLDEWARRFEAFGWRTVTAEGHDLDDLDDALSAALDGRGPVAVLARTIKGRGVPDVEDEPGHHGKPVDDADTVIAGLGGPGDGRIDPAPPPEVEPTPSPTASRVVERQRWEVGQQVATRDAWGAAVRELGARRHDVVVLDGEVGNSTRAREFARAHPDRFVQAYISEQNMLGMAIGLAAAGWRPFVASFGAFLSRAVDFARMVPVSGLDMVLVGSHAGVSIGEDGPSQMALEDLAWTRAIAGSTVLYPSDANQAAALTDLAVDQPGVTYLRTTRGATPVLASAGPPARIGGSRVLRSGPDDDAVVVAAGITVHEAVAAVDDLGVPARVVDAYSIQPLDVDTIAKHAAATDAVVVVEDHRRAGGLGEAVATALLTAGVTTDFRHLAVDTMPASATADEQLQLAGIDRGAIADAVADVAGR